MQPSSLIFLVLIAIWAAYLLRHWVRRREHLATARSVDRFSDAMRVLERRSPLSGSVLPVPDPRSYAVSPARPSRPEVVVKRAQSPTLDLPTPPVAAVRPTRVFHLLAGVSARRLRGLSLLASLSLAFVVAALAAFSPLSSWSLMVPAGVLVTDVLWLRHIAVSERAAARARGRSRGSAAPPASSAARLSEVRDPVAVAPAAARVADVVDLTGEAAEPTDEVFGLTDEVSQPTGEVAEPAGEVFEPAGEVFEPTGAVDPSGWAPVPVPPPTYTLKARAERPMPIPAFVELTEYAPVQPLIPDGEVYEGEVGGHVEGRRAAGA